MGRGGWVHIAEACAFAEPHELVEEELPVAHNGCGVGAGPGYLQGVEIGVSERFSRCVLAETLQAI